MRISAYIEKGIDKESCDERLYIRYYHRTEDMSLYEGGTLVLNEGEYDADVDTPLMTAISDGREEYPGANLASEMVVHELKKFRMPMFLKVEMKKKEEKEEKDENEEDETSGGGNVAFINGSLGGMPKETMTLEDMQNMGNGMGDLIDLKDDAKKEKKEDKTKKDYEPDEEKVKELKKFLLKVNNNILEEGKKPWARENMAACLTGLVCTGQQSFYFNFGNIHLLRKKGLSDYWESIIGGKAGDEKKSGDKRRLCCLGSDKDRSGDMQAGDCSAYVGEGKRLALLGEGVFNYIELNVLRKLLAQKKNPLDICRDIANTARDKGSLNDISVVLFNFSGEA